MVELIQELSQEKALIVKQPERKRGKLSIEEQKFIEDSCNKNKLSLEEIAKAINRTTEPVARYIREQNLVYSGSNLRDGVYVDLRQKLRGRHYWPELEAQFVEHELEYFENMWVDLIRQFREDVLATEEYQIKQLITIEILMSRSMRNRRKSIEDVERLQRLIDKEYKKPEEGMNKEGEPFRDILLLKDMHEQLGTSAAAQQAYTTEHSKLAADSKRLMTDLKATRDQRLRKIEDSKTTWIGLIKMLEDEETRNREGNELGLVNKSVEKARKQYGGSHKYLDLVEDLPILNSDTIETYIENEELLDKQEREKDANNEKE